MADESFKKVFLDTHNALRKKHGTAPVTMSTNLCASSQEWADHLISINKLEHSSTKNGENIYFAWSSGPKVLTGTEAVDSWYSEIKDYSWSSPGFGFNTGHFTQVVWKETTEIGVGVATDGQNIYVVGQYSPAGNMNMDGYFQANVLPLAGGASGASGASGNTSDGDGGGRKGCSLL